MNRTVAIHENLAGLLALACAVAVVLGTALEAEARLGPAGTAVTSPQGPAATAAPPPPPP